MLNEPLVSVLMTAYNREKYIAEAIESVLASTYKNFELIIVDDCSEDNTVAIARSYEQKDNRVKVYVNEHNLGDYPNRNKAVSYAKGKYIKYLDSDDIIYCYGLDVMVNYMERFPDAGFALSSISEIQRSFPICISPFEIYHEHFNGFGHFDRAPGSSIIKREVFNSIGGFSGKRMIGDYEFWLKISREYPMVKIPIDLYWSRIHEGSELQSNYAKINYGRLKHEVLTEALLHPSCPMDAEQIHLILKKNSIKMYKMGIKQILYKIKHYL